MNDFEWLRQGRELRRDQRPTRDLWPGIAASLAPRTRRRGIVDWLPAMAAAAVVVLGMALGAAALHAPVPLADGSLARASRWKPADPRLAGAAIEFQAADSEIRLAMQQAPDADFLKRIRARTQAQQWRVQRYAQQAP